LIYILQGFESPVYDQPIPPEFAEAVHGVKHIAKSSLDVTPFHLLDEFAI